MMKSEVRREVRLKQKSPHAASYPHRPRATKFETQLTGFHTRLQARTTPQLEVRSQKEKAQLSGKGFICYLLHISVRSCTVSDVTVCHTTEMAEVCPPQPAGRDHGVCRGQ